VTQRKHQRLVTRLRQCPPSVILAVAGRADGHTIFKPEAFLDCGLPKEIVEYLTRSYSSDGSPKGTIFVQGQAVEKLSGVYGLELLRFLASALGVEYAPKLGRGSEAREIQAALRRHFQSPAS
jgi:hypothetical protein